MPRLWIDGREVEVEEGKTILDAARKLGIDIPALCHVEGRKPSTSCMVCVVRLEGTGGLVPSCATAAREGMRVESETEGVREARKTALELLLSDHLGDCLAPCHTICPAGMNIPLMIRHIAAGRLRDAVAVVKEDIALPAILGRICPAPCEKGCRRSQKDAPVSICLLKRFLAEADLASGDAYLPPREPGKGKRVAVVGAGPAGLACAYHLLRRGYACTVLDERDHPGGMLRYGVGEDRLPRDVLDAEIGVIEKLGAEFRSETKIGKGLSLEDLRKEFDAVFLGVGEIARGDVEKLSLEATDRGIRIDARTHATSVEGVFAGGSAVRKGRMAVRSLAHGKAAALSIEQYLSGLEVTGPSSPFTTRIGKLKEGEIDRFMVGASEAPRVAPAGDGFSEREAREEARRCLGCDCRKPELCRLRRYAEAYGARTKRDEGERRTFEIHLGHPEVVYEPGKCIACGVCVEIAREAGEPLGLTFIGRGFDVRVRVPFGGALAEGLKEAAARCARACPTGALAFKDREG